MRKSLNPDETILGLLAIRAQHGYELLDSFRIPSQLGRIWTMSASQLYVVLKRLKAKGWIVGREIPSDNAPTRTEYHLTDTGKQALLAWLHEQNPSPRIRRVRVEFLSRLYVARALGIPSDQIVRRQQAACQRERVRLAEECKHAAPGIDLLAVEFVIGQLDAVLGWLERCESLLPTLFDEPSPRNETRK